MTSAPLGDSTSVWPSGAARLTSPSAMRPAAPGLLSTMTFCPSEPRIFSASSRAMTSAEPPGGKADQDAQRAVLRDRERRREGGGGQRGEVAALHGGCSCLEGFDRQGVSASWRRAGRR
jgi:hypothetical protein